MYLSLIHRVIAGFAVVIFLVLGISVSAYLSQNKMAAQLQLTSTVLPGMLDNANALLVDIQNINRITLSHANANDATHRQALEVGFHQAVDQYHQSYQSLAQKLQTHRSLQTQLSEINQQATRVIEQATQHLKLQNEKEAVRQASSSELTAFESGWKTMARDLGALNSEAEWNNKQMAVIDLDVAESKGKNVQGLLQKVMLVDDQSAITAITDQLNEYLSEFTTRLNNVMKAMPESKSTLQKYVDLLHRTVSEPQGLLHQHVRYLSLQQQSQRELQTMSRNVDTIIDHAETLTEKVRSIATQARHTADSQAQFSIWSILISALIAIIVAVFVAVTVVYSIKSPLAVMTKALNELSQGNLTWRIKETFRSEMGVVVRDINALGEQLHQVIGTMHDSSRTLSRVATDSHTMIDKIHRDLVTQDKQTNSMAAAVTEMETAVNEVAKYSGDTSQEVEQVTRLANHNIENMQSNLQYIESLKTSLDEASSLITTLSQETESINQVIEMIQNVSEQTNLLALNAAIEAARAGESGRGFAVVADEVRTLATHSRESADEINSKVLALQKKARDAVTLMTENQEYADQSVTQTQETHQSLTSMINRLAAINDMSRSIAVSCEQQSVVAKDVAENIVNISDMANTMTQDSNTLAQHSHSLDELAKEQGMLVAKFTI
ncbi:methyl-accepting chemotaxis protein [Vibrio zhugei]|uniref:Methyl-accepting chemotaxis protein n=1 Tax=Vibrio zhugei TaxID=2479546 RepID=A0ABV7C7N8_9VIBR|nr:methyl-accepting chemotaxis protein [Vibrio zhugei]